jgi:hypothetical protein
MLRRERRDCDEITLQCVARKPYFTHLLTNAKFMILVELANGPPTSGRYLRFLVVRTVVFATARVNLKKCPCKPQPTAVGAMAAASRCTTTSRLRTGKPEAVDKG